MVMHGGLGKLAYYKPGDKAWTTMDRSYGWFYYVIWYKGQCYALDCRGRILVCEFRGDVDDQLTTARVVASMPDEHREFYNHSYLEDSAGALLVVRKRIKHEMQLINRVDLKFWK